VKKRLWFFGFILKSVLALIILGKSAFGQMVPTSLAQETAPSAPAAAAPTPGVKAVTEENDISTPRGMLAQFYRYAKRGNFHNAEEFIDFGGRNVSDEERRIKTRKFVTVLDMLVTIDPSKVSNETLGDREDGLRFGRDRIGYAELGHEVVPILIERIDENGAFIWKFSKRTVDKLVDLYDTNQYAHLLERLPRILIEWRFLSVYLWQWIVLIGFVLLAFAVAWVIMPLLGKVIRPLVNRKRDEFKRNYTYAGKVTKALLEHSRALVAIGIFYIFVLSMPLAKQVEIFLQSLINSLLVIIITNILFSVVNASTEWMAERPTVQENRSYLSVIPLIRRVMKITLVVIALLILLKGFGINVTAVVAGLGIGGLAVALAAQKTIENLFGGVTLVLDKPIRVGDFCRFGSSVGTVEDVGLRSTRIRTLDRSLISIPNADFSQMQIENIGLRERIRFYTVIPLRFETTADQIRLLVIEFKKILLSHPLVDPDPARVRFVRIGANGYEIEVTAYLRTMDWGVFCAGQEDILLRFMDAMARIGVRIAMQSQTLYMRRDYLEDPEKQQQAQQQIQSMRENHQFYLNEIPSDVVQQLKDTIKFPEQV
jgi:MscS family membrane protein